MRAIAETPITEQIMQVDMARIKLKWALPITIHNCSKTITHQLCTRKKIIEYISNKQNEKCLGELSPPWAPAATAQVPAILSVQWQVTCPICFLMGPRFAAVADSYSQVVIDLRFLPASIEVWQSSVWGDGMENWGMEISSQLNWPIPWLWKSLSCPLVSPDEISSNVNQLTRALGVTPVVAVRWSDSHWQRSSLTCTGKHCAFSPDGKAKGLNPSGQSGLWSLFSKSYWYALGVRCCWILLDQ